jgi:hypothetical protein
MRAVPHQAIAAIRDERAGRAVGVVRATATIVAPLSGQACVAYHLAFAGGEEAATIPFTLEDPSGDAAVDPQDCWMTLDHRLPIYRGLSSELPPAVRDAMRRAGQPAYLVDSRGMFTWASEGRIEPGDRIAAVGAMTRSPERPATVDYRRSPGHLLRLTGAAGAPIMLSNAPETMR